MNRLSIVPRFPYQICLVLVPIRSFIIVLNYLVHKYKRIIGIIVFNISKNNTECEKIRKSENKANKPETLDWIIF